MKKILALLIALALLGGCKEDQQASGGGAQPRIYHTDQPKESVPECPTWILLAAGGVLILAHFMRYEK
jgi:hypothetical protein